MQKKKKPKSKVSNIFIIINVLFLASCILFYGARLIHYYKLEHPKIEPRDNLFKLVTLDKNVILTGDGLYKEEGKYVYKGIDVDNYIYYSGRIFRILSIDKDGNLKLIADLPQTSLVYGIEKDYVSSYVREWLNSEDKGIKSFYESLSNTDILIDTKTCIDVVTPTKISCNKFIMDKVGLLSIYEYNLAGGEKSYLNIDEYWWSSNIDDENSAWYFYSKGVNNNVNAGDFYYAYGVRPTITIQGDILVYSGDGKKDSPYVISSSNTNVLNKKYVGEYVSFSDYTWRIIETDDEYVKLVMDGFIQVNDKDYITKFGKKNLFDATSDIGYYLNNTFYKSLNDKESIIKFDFNNGRYDKSYKYDYTKITEYKEKAYVGLLQLSELFITDFEGYFLSTRTITTENTIYQVLENGIIYAGYLTDELKVRPTIYIKADLIIESGKGTKKDPYKMG